MVEVKRLIELDFPVERMNELARKESSANFTRKPIYNMHKWWARRISSTFRAICLLTVLSKIDENSVSLGAQLDDFSDFNNRFWGKVDKHGQIIQKGIFYTNVDLQKTLGYRPIVLDPFMGGGTTVIEALRLGCKVIGIDLNPVAWFVTKNEIEPIDLKIVDEKFRQLSQYLSQKMKSYYKTSCPRCIEDGKRSKVDCVYIFWVKKVKCANCNKEVGLYRNFVLASPKRDKPTVFCPKCSTVFKTSNTDLAANCPNCKHRFIPSKGVATGGKYTCPYCNQKQRILETVRRQLRARRKPEGELWYPEEAEIYAIENFCPQHGREYKAADKSDREIFEKARKEFLARIDELRSLGVNIFGKYIPEQLVPKDKADPRPNNYGYEYFWQMFNGRQLLCLSLLLEYILKIEDKRTREFFLLIFSDMVNLNNTFCAYNSKQRVITDLFARHGYPHKVAPVENNVWGVADVDGDVVGTGSFLAFFNKAKKGAKFQRNTFERMVTGDRTIRVPTGDVVEGRLANNFQELVSKDFNVLLLARDAQDMSFIPSNPQSIDVVITDPPYYDNVMYSELADFYYVWLRLGLKDEYEEFKPLYTAKAQEIVVNSKARKDEESYVTSLTNVFKECCRFLKEDGLLVFTYHHTLEETWAVILKAVLDAGFNIVWAYPIHSEMVVSTHIREKQAREFDTIIVAKKRSLVVEPITWERLKDQIYLEANHTIDRVRRTHPSLTNGDKSTIILGKCLELYSKHYPQVEGIGRDVNRAIEGIRDIIQDLYSKTSTPKSDAPTEFYLEHLVKEGSVHYNELLKLIQSREVSVTVDDLKNSGMLAPKGSELVIVDPLTRGRQLAELSRSGHYDLRYYVDAIHLYYYLFGEGKKLPRLSELGDFDLHILNTILRYMASTLKDDRYRKIIDLIEVAREQPKGLEKFM